MLDFNGKLKDNVSMVDGENKMTNVSKEEKDRIQKLYDNAIMELQEAKLAAEVDYFAAKRSRLVAQEAQRKADDLWETYTFLERQSAKAVAIETAEFVEKLERLG